MKTLICLLCACLLLGACVAHGQNKDAALEPLTASWIWRKGADVHAYNQTIVALREVKMARVSEAIMRITADSFYRLYINGVWINDGPARNWPEHYQYDELNVTPYLVAGKNEIRIVARYYGVGDFHRVPKQAGLLAQLDAKFADGGTRRLVTDGSWKVANADAWAANTPKVSIQMEPVEWYDARLEQLQFKPAVVLFGADQGPWKSLAPRDTALLTRQPIPFKTFLGAKAVKTEALNFCLPAARLANPGLIEANNRVSSAVGMASILNNAAECPLELQAEGMKFSIDGNASQDGKYKLAPGKHLVLAFVQNPQGHEKERSLRFWNPDGFKLQNPMDKSQANPWCLIRFDDCSFATNDMVWIGFPPADAQIAAKLGQYGKITDQWLKEIKTVEAFNEKISGRCKVLSHEEMFVLDSAWQFQQRRVVADASECVSQPSALMHDNAGVTTVHPSAKGDVELLYDLGEQSCGYYAFELTAEAGVCVDIFSLEYIAEDGRIQHSWGNRNGMRYIAKAGVNRFTSLKRRSGRYVFLTLRNQKAPVQIRHLNLIESTYPVEYIGSFNCSDSRLDKIWDISTRTLKLCMEDTFTDCPLYEQTHWVGDARNESLLAYNVFGATDIARRCIWQTAQSLERYPIAGCQVPSTWDCLLPAWSFLWGISTWDHYWHTGDMDFLKAIYPSVIRNLKGAESFVVDKNLFSGTFWNLFDWSGIDQGPKTVLHNSMFMVGAIDAALKSAEVLKDDTDVKWLKALRQKLVAAINVLWDDNKKSYPDSIRDDGTISPSTCQHTSFLSILYDVIEKQNIESARKNLTNPPEKMVRIGSPFAMLYLYETLEKIGMEDEIIQQIYKNYLPMVESGATTVWESFPTGTTGSGGFPTRSHCHAWSSAPTYFLNRIVLGAKATAPGGGSFTLSPRLSGLTWAKGTIATVKGPLSVSWKLNDKKIEIRYTAPEGVKVVFTSNESLNGLKVVINGKAL